MCRRIAVSDSPGVSPPMWLPFPSRVSEPSSRMFSGLSGASGFTISVGRSGPSAPVTFSDVMFLSRCRSTSQPPAPTTTTTTATAMAMALSTRCLCGEWLGGVACDKGGPTVEGEDHPATAPDSGHLEGYVDPPCPDSLKSWPVREITDPAPASEPVDPRLPRLELEPLAARMGGEQHGCTVEGRDVRRVDLGGHGGAVGDHQHRLLLPGAGEGPDLRVLREQQPEPPVHHDRVAVPQVDQPPVVVEDRVGVRQRGCGVDLAVVRVDRQPWLTRG